MVKVERIPPEPQPDRFRITLDKADAQRLLIALRSTTYGISTDITTQLNKYGIYDV